MTGGDGIEFGRDLLFELDMAAWSAFDYSYCVYLQNRSPKSELCNRRRSRHEAFPWDNPMTTEVAVLVGRLTESLGLRNNSISPLLK